MREHARKEPFEGGEPVETAIEIWLGELTPLYAWVKERGEMLQKILVLGVEKTLIVVVGGDECRERNFSEVLVDSFRLTDVRDAHGRNREMTEVVKRGNGRENVVCLQPHLLRASPDKDVARKTATHMEVSPAEEAEREDFFHGEVARELAEEEEKLLVRQSRPRMRNGYVEKLLFLRRSNRLIVFYFYNHGLERVWRCRTVSIRRRC